VHRRIFDWRLASQLWLGSRQAARHTAQWEAHAGGVYGLAVLGEGARRAAAPGAGCVDGFAPGEAASWRHRARAQCSLWRCSISGAYPAPLLPARLLRGPLRVAAHDPRSPPLRTGSPSPVLLSVGDDGYLRGWSIPAIGEAAAAVAAQQQHYQQQPPAAGGVIGTAAAGPEAVPLKPLFEAQVPRSEPPFPVAVPAAPAAQAVVVGTLGGGAPAAFVGASDGGCHAFDLARLGSGGKRGGGGSRALPGHAAAVLGVDFCSATGQLATASEVRGDARTGLDSGGARSGGAPREGFLRPPLALARPGSCLRPLLRRLPGPVQHSAPFPRRGTAVARLALRLPPAPQPQTWRRAGAYIPRDPTLAAPLVLARTRPFACGTRARPPPAPRPSTCGPAPLCRPPRRPPRCAACARRRRPRSASARAASGLWRAAAADGWRYGASGSGPAEGSPSSSTPAAARHRCGLGPSPTRSRAGRGGCGTTSMRGKRLPECAALIGPARRTPPRPAPPRPAPPLPAPPHPTPTPSGPVHGAR
jgi:hypothetical protein